MNKRVLLISSAVVAGLLAGCGGSDGGDAAGGKSGTVKVGAALDLTGPNAFAGTEVKKGMDVAIAQANASNALGSAKIELTAEDNATDAKQAASLISKMVRDDYSVLVTGPGSGPALASGPIAQRAEIPMVVPGAGAPGVVEAGDYVFRASAPQEHYHHLGSSYLKSKGATTIAQIYNNDVPTNKLLGEKTWPALAKQNGLQITSSSAVPITATNFASIVSKITGSSPDAVVLHTTGVQGASAATALRRAGYQGIIVGGNGLSSGNLKTMGAQADGIVYAVDFSADTPVPSGKEFAALYQRETGNEPSMYAATGYDTMQLIINGLKRARDYSPEAVKAGLDAATREGFAAAAGDYKFENRDARVDGLLVEWRGGKEHVVTP
jgi:branched-chain amino acid transport system substrate-binding protein